LFLSPDISSLVKPGFIPALQTDHSSIMLTMLLSNSVFGFLPKSIADPYLQSNMLYRIPLPFESPIIKGCACYMTEKRQQHRLPIRISSRTSVSNPAAIRVTNNQGIRLLFD
jgi:DNA-binding transcriptional LysR family regulator